MDRNDRNKMQYELGRRTIQFVDKLYTTLMFAVNSKYVYNDLLLASKLMH